MVIDMRY